MSILIDIIIGNIKMTSGLDYGFPFDLLVDWFPDLIGCMGTIIVLAAYALLQMGKLKSNGVLFSFLNFMAAFMILISLFYTWNLAAFVMEFAWMVISAYGMVRVIFSDKSVYERAKS